MLGLLAIVCPPVAVLLAGTPSQAVANLGLTLFFYFPGLLHARSLLERQATGRRNELIMRLAERYCA